VRYSNISKFFILKFSHFPFIQIEKKHRVFVLAFVTHQMSSFQMESLKVMEKFDGGNFHLWKFKMRMMLSKHELWKFVDEMQQFPMMKIKSRIITKRRPRHLHYFVNISRMHNLHTFNIAKMSKALGKHFVMSMKPRPSKTSCFFEGGSSPSKCKKGRTCLCTSTW
jgi:hypothetical protein